MLSDFDLVVVGGGSGGYGAALAASRRGLKVLLVEAAHMLGGNSTSAGVNTWEPGICGPGLSAELFQNLSARNGAIGLSRTVKHYTDEQPWGLSEIDAGLCYDQSLRRAGATPDEWVRVTFEPEIMAREMEKLLRQAGTVLALNTRFVGAQTKGNLVTELRFSSPTGQWKAKPRLVIDSTASIHVARDVGCETRLGEDPRGLHGETSAPEVATRRLNGVSLCFRIQRTQSSHIEALPPEVSPQPFHVSVAMTQYPNGDLCLNPLPIMEGWEYLRHCETHGVAATRRECEHRVRRFWHGLQAEHGFSNWRLAQIFPAMGVREGARLVGREVLTEHDVRAGWQNQRGAEHAVAMADHALDIHGAGHLCRELEQPYGVPYECLLPQEYENLAVACRGASFSHLAASSCRLSRTMMDLGHAAGLAAALAVESSAGFADVAVDKLRGELRHTNVSVG